MRIAIDASKYADKQATGVELYCTQIIDVILEEAAATLAKNDSVELFCRRRLQFDGGVLAAVRRLGKRLKQKVIRRRRLWTLIGLSRGMKKSRPDVLFVPGHVLPFFCPKHTVTTIHDVAFRRMSEVYTWSQYFYLNWSTKRAVRKASCIVVPSQATRKDLIEIFRCDPEKIRVIAHGFSKRAFLADKVNKKLPYLADGRPFLLFIGRLESKKNLERLVAAFAEFAQSHPEYKLILAGQRGVGFKQVWKLVQSLRLEQDVIMPGYVTEDEKATLLKKARAFCFPSLYEGFGFPILEAFACDLPVMTAKFSSMPEVGGEAVAYCDPFDYHDMAMTMEQLACNESYRQDLIKAGRERLGKFSWKKAGKASFKVLYEQ